MSCAVILLTVPAAYLTGALTIAHLYVAAFLTGVCSVVFGVAYQALLVTLVERKDYIAASSWLSASLSVTQAFGSTAAGAVVNALGAPLALTVDALTFLFGARQLGKIDPVEPPPRPRERVSVAEGLGWIWRHKVMRTLLASAALTNAGVFVTTAVLVVHAARVLHLDGAALGLAFGAGAIGGLVGAVTCQRVERRLGLGRLAVLAALIYAGSFLVFPLAPSSNTWLAWACLAAAEAVSFVGAVWADISLGTAMAHLVPDELRARVSGAYRFVNFGVRPLGALIGGVIASMTDTRVALFVGGFTCLAGALVRMRRHVLELRT